jgi:hypothetical protein
VYKYFFILVLFVLHSTLGGVYGQASKEYYNIGLSFRGGTLENSFVGKLKYYDSQFGVGYIRRFNRPLIIVKSQYIIDAGCGIWANMSHTSHVMKELRRTMNSIEISPVTRLFFLLNGFFELGYSFEYFTDGHVIIKDSSSNNLYTIPRDIGLQTGISIGAGYIIEIKDFIAIEPRLVMNLNNYAKSETDKGISDDIIRNIRFVISINLVSSK